MAPGDSQAVGSGWLVATLVERILSTALRVYEFIIANISTTSPCFAIQHGMLQYEPKPHMCKYAPCKRLYILVRQAALARWKKKKKRAKIHQRHLFEKSASASMIPASVLDSNNCLHHMKCQPSQSTAGPDQKTSHEVQNVKKKKVGTAINKDEQWVLTPSPQE